MSVMQPDLCRRVALRYTAALIPICMSAPLLGMFCLCGLAPDCCLCRCLRPAVSLPDNPPTPRPGVTTEWFALDSTALNMYFAYRAWDFYRTGSPETARKLFLTSLWHLPAVMGLLLAHSAA